MAKKEFMKYFKNLSVLSKITWLIFCLSFFIVVYIRATTNRLYRQDVNEFLAPFYVTLSIIYLTCFFTIIAIDFKNKRLLVGAKFVGLSIAFLSVIIELFDFSPCFLKHSNSLTDHVHPHTLSFTLSHSFLCPNFSQPSRLLLIFLFILGMTIWTVFHFLALRNKKPSSP